MSEGGLTRRRGAAGNSPNPSQHAFDTPPTSAGIRQPTSNLGSTSRPSSSLARPVMGAAAAGNAVSTAAVAGGSGGSGAVEGRGKIAFDPRDYENGSMGSEYERMPRLTIMEEVLLLGLKDKQGYLSFWNDNISYALRGCILVELALRRRIAVVKDPSRRRLALPDRLIEVIDERQTGETILDEALKMMKSSEKYGTGAWIDLMSGETWNVMKIGYQLKQVRERLAKGLVDKGVLRTEKRNFLLFDMATHPIADVNAKEDVLRRALTLLTARTTAIPGQALHKENVQYRVIRAVALVCSAYAANVLENALQRLSYDARESAFVRCDDILLEFSTWPFGTGSGSSSGGADQGPVAIGGGPSKRRNASISGMGSSGGKESVMELVREVKKEMNAPLPGNSTAGKADDGEDLCFEVVACVFNVLSAMESLL
ncbi:Vacuolar protein sorting-associated protein 74 [Naganishia onofrii]|uniref:Vacuolar protein sorting-associated protein 74 n=1 Tax=Naganishia onofrii TaxID=1851511 RepID=A0ACC2XBD3_9TREE|nr:Vacuolar protein sorting-associated protein 74 [Naganishia onofrii]